VVQRAPDHASVDHSIGEDPAIMGARASNREELSVKIRKQHGFVADPAGDGGTSRDFRNREAFGKIRSGCG
jgi:hypothetical protein